MNEADGKKLKGMVVEISNALTRMSGERELINEICKRGQEELEIDGKLVRKLGKVYYSQNLQQMVDETDAVNSTYYFIFNQVTQ